MTYITYSMNLVMSWELHYLLYEPGDELGATLGPAPGTGVMVQGGGHNVVSGESLLKHLTLFVVIVR